MSCRAFMEARLGGRPSPAHLYPPSIGSSPLPRKHRLTSMAQFITSWTRFVSFIGTIRFFIRTIVTFIHTIPCWNESFLERHFEAEFVLKHLVHAFLLYNFSQKRALASILNFGHFSLPNIGWGGS